MSLQRLLHGALLALVLMTIASGASSATVRLNPLAQAIVLTGARGSTSLVFRLATAQRRNHSAELNLQWATSELVNAQQSSLSIHLDGRVLRTFRLAKSDTEAPPFSSQRLIDLGPLKAGQHRLEISTRLSVDGDPCLQLQKEEAWLQLLPTTQITYSSPTLKRARELSLAQLPSSLQALSPEGYVQLVPPHSPTRPGALALVEAHHLLKSWGLKPVLQQLALQSSPLPRLLFWSISQPGNSTSTAQFQQAIAQLKRAPPAAKGVVAIDGTNIALIARAPRHLAGLVRQLQLTSIRQLCPQQEPCLLGEVEPKVALAPSTSLDAATVLQFSQFGYRLGWTARGAGTHSLHFVWNRPASWKITSPPRLELDLRVPRQGFIDQERSYLTVSLNEQPLASWSLGPSKELPQKLVVKLPTEHWKQAAWVFEITVTLFAQAGIPCEAVAPDGLWAVLGPESHISVNRHEPQYSGLASFYHQARSVRPQLHWRQLEQWSQVLQLAKILHPLALLTAHTAWEFHQSPFPSGTKARLSLHPPRLGPPLGFSADVGHRRLLHDESGHLGAPLLDKRSVTLLSHREESATGPEEIKIHLADTAPARCPAPPYSELLGRHALCVENLWVGLGQEKNPTDTVTVNRAPSTSAIAAERLRSDDENTVRWVNLIWTALALLTAVGFAAYAWRRPRTPYQPLLNIEEPETNSQPSPPLESPPNE